MIYYEQQKQLLRIAVEIVIVLAIGLLMFMGLAVYNGKVIQQQRDLIRLMQSNPACVNAPGGNHG